MNWIQVFYFICVHSISPTDTYKTNGKTFLKIKYFLQISYISLLFIIKFVTVMQEKIPILNKCSSFCLSDNPVNKWSCFHKKLLNALE